MAKKKTRVLLPGGIQGLVHDLQNGTSHFKPQAIVADAAAETDETEEETPETLAAEAETVQSASPVGMVSEDRPQTVEPAGGQQSRVGDGQNQPAIAAETATKGEDVSPDVAASRSDAADFGPTASDARPGTAVDSRSAVADSQPENVDARPKTALHSSSETVASRPEATGAEPARSSLQPVGVDAPQANATPSAEHMRGRRPKENTMKEYHIVRDDSTDSWQLFLDMAQQYKTGGGKLATIYIDESLKNVLDRMKYAGPDRLSTSAILSSIVARFIYDHEDDIKKVLFSGNLI